MTELFKYRQILASGCWNWTGATSTNSTGSSKYGRYKYKGKLWRVHRLAWVLNGHTLNPSDQLNHSCGNSLCFNPSHLYVGDASQNAHDSVRDKTHYCAGKTHCPHGHDYTVYGVIASDGFRHCIICHPKFKKWARP